MYRDAGMKCDNKWSLTSEMFFQCTEVDAVVGASKNTVPMTSAG